MNTKFFIIFSLFFLQRGALYTQETDSLQKSQDQQEMFDRIAIAPYKLMEDKTSVYFNLGYQTYINAPRTDFLMPTLGIEQKIFTYYSIGFNLSYKYPLLKYRQSGVKVPYRLYGKYYYNLKERIMEGKTGNNFSANYIQLGCRFEPFTDIHGDSYYDYERKLWRNKEIREWKLNPELELLFGWRRQFHKYLYYDIVTGVSKNSKPYHSSNDSNLVFKISLGFTL